MVDTVQPPGLPSHNTRTALLSAGFGLAEEEAPIREPDGPAAARESGTGPKGPQGSRACDRVGLPALLLHKPGLLI